MPSDSYAKRLIVALDYPDFYSAWEMVCKTQDLGISYKVGTELFYSLARSGGSASIFSKIPNLMLDLKLHDTPTTVRKTLECILPILVDSDLSFLTVHAKGGVEMMKVAISTLKNKLGRGKIAPVMRLTTDPDELPMNAWKKLEEAGAEAYVCSPGDLCILCPTNMDTICPSIRPVGHDGDDHLDSCSPDRAFFLGADYLVVGRPITRAGDPRAVIQEILVDVKAWKGR